MGLTDREKEIIAQMEHALASEDPRLVATMEQRRRSLALNILAILGGIALLLTGVIAKFALLGILGFLVALGGAATIRIGKPAFKFNRPAGGKVQERWNRRNQ